MEKKDVSSLRPDMVLAKTIYNKKGLVLLYEGVRLTGSYINSLQNIGIEEVYVFEDKKRDYEFPEIMSNHIKKKAYGELWSYMRRITNRRLERTKRIKNYVENIVQRILQEPIILLYMMDLFFFDDYTLNHSLHVLFLSILLGVELDLEEKQLLDLGRGAFLHDIGKMKVPMEIINKPEELVGEEWAIMKKHTTMGYKMIKAFDVLSKEAASILLHHHERVDGIGYPHHLRGREIHLYNRIVALADVFDAISSHRPHRKGKDYHTTIETMKTKKLFLEDPLLPIFLRNIAFYPEGSKVLLSNKYRGTVVENHRDDPKSPKVKLLQNPEGHLVELRLFSLLKKRRIYLFKQSYERTKGRTQRLTSHK